MKKTSLYIGVAIAAGAILVAVPVFAATQPGSTFGHFLGFDKREGAASSSVVRPAVLGVVTAISGATLTVVAIMPMRQKGVATSTYAVDASNATVTSGFGTTTATVALSNIGVNSRVAVFGTISGTSVAATKIAILPAMPVGMRPKPSNANPGNWLGNEKGSGQGHVTIGSVTAINGAQFSIATKMPKQATTTETIVTTSATTFKENGQAGTLGNVTVGNIVMATGTTTAPSVFTASTVRIMAPRAKMGAHN